MDTRGQAAALAFSKPAGLEPALLQKICIIIAMYYIRINISQEILLPELHCALTIHRLLYKRRASSPEQNTSSSFAIR